MCGFHTRFSSIVSRRKLNSVTLSTGSQFIFKVGVLVLNFFDGDRKSYTLFYLRLETIYLYSTILECF